MRIDPQQVKELRHLTKAGVMECKRALEQTSGDMDKALELLQEKAEQTLAEKAEKTIKAGYVYSYIHGDGRIGVLVEARCETDFLSKSEEFRTLVKDIALHIASEAPEYVAVSDVPVTIIEQIKHETETMAKEQGKPAHVVDTIKAGRVKKYLANACLLEQPFHKNPDLQVADLIQALSLKSGENLRLANFCRYQID